MVRQRLWMFASLVSCLASATFADGEEEAPVYSLGAPLQPGFVSFRISQGGTLFSQNRWMNDAFVASGGVATNTAVTARDSENPSQKRYTIVSSEMGFGWERNKPDYYLSDVITPPDNVDWNATKALYDETYAELEAQGKSPAFLYNPDPDNLCIYAVAGGTQKFSWILNDGVTNTLTYTIASTCSGRPRRIFWTDSPYNAPTISMQGKFVRIFDNNGVTKVETGTVTNSTGGVVQEQADTIVAGVYVDEESQVMYAKGQRQGQFVLAYYDTGDYKNILCVEVIEVAKPEAVTAHGTIGEKLVPYGVEYDETGLEAVVYAGVGDADDERGDYLYQHSGEYSYSPKSGEVYPLRPSVGMRWKAEIYWMETDPMGVQWPFVLNAYENDWPASGHLYVRGDDPADSGAKIYIPDDYEATLGDYQEPNGHAVAVDGDNVFYTKGEGWSLLKLTGDDNIWFLPIHSVSRANKAYFTLESHDVTIGQEFILRGGTVSGVALGAKELVTATNAAPGYVYRPASGTQYNADLYYETTNATADADSQISTDVVGDATSGTTAPSAIFAVNEGAKDIEVWWSRREQLEDMPAWIDIPTLPQVYHPVWPDATEAPTIVLASQLGSAGESLFQQYGAATFGKANGRLELVSREYFPNGEGMVSFWTRPSSSSDPIDGVTNAPSALLQLGTTNGLALVMRIGHDEKLEMLVGTNLVTAVDMPKTSRPNIWTHVALAISDNATKYVLYLNAENKADGALPDAGFLGGMLTRCVAGRAVEMPEGLVLGDPAEKIVPAPQFDGDGLTWESCNTWAAVKENLLAGKNVKLTANIEQDSDTITFDKGQKAVLDLYGCELTGWDDNRVFSIQSGAELTIIDSSSGKKGTVVGAKVVCNDGGAMIRVRAGGKLTIYGGTFTDAMADEGNGGCVSVEAGGVFEMNGGTIEACSAPGFSGGAVYSAGTFTMNGGAIKDCSALNGAAVYNAGGTFTFAGGTIKDCTATERGGAVASVGGTATMDYGLVKGCTAGTGGAIDCSASATFTMNGGVLAGNEALEKGGAVMLTDSTFTMNAGVIGTNVAQKAWAGVCSSGESTFTLNGGAIVGNKIGEVRSCVGCDGTGEVIMNGGLVDAEPTVKNVNPDGTGSFDEPIYFRFVTAKFPTYRIALGVAVGRQLAEITMRSKIPTATGLEDARYRILTGSEDGVTGYYSFRPGEDLVSVYQRSFGADFRHFSERSSGLEFCRACNAYLLTPGAPGYHSCVISADETPSVYYRNRKDEDGYNPNEEHAFVKSGSGGYVAWALRNDLNTDDSSKPGVLVQYVKDGAAQMQFFHVVVTNADWPTLTGTCTAGRMLPGPKPITAMDDPWLPEDYWERDPANKDRPGAVYRDRKGQLYARCAGTIPIYMYYRLQDGFWFPQYGDDEQPAVGTAVPWLALAEDSGKDPLAGRPVLWTWTASWPAVANVMKIGQTLYEAKNGLPGVYNMKSVSIIYPAPCEQAHATETVTLVDPTVKQSVAFDYTLLAELGLTTDKNGGLTLRKGVYTFNELPPNLSSRVTVDPTNNKLYLAGEYEKNTANSEASMLYMNVLSAAERNQLLNVVPESMRKGSAWTTWQEAVAALGASRVEPNASRMTADGSEVKTDYTPRDSYALTARGGTGWVVLIENDAPSTNFTATVNGVAKSVNMGVAAGDSINIHTLFVTNEYYQGYIIAREDEQNLLSQRLSILYTQCLGGDTDDFVFEWRSASPTADGKVPENYDDEQTYIPRAESYADYNAPRITIGEQGDTLANMVNKYWICRYQAKKGTAAYATMGSAWSPWCAPPCLAEGWVQRVLNNVTPFNQLMTDLYENEAETAVSMIEKAGKPYTGDVAFNQDALTECGLIELYETLFNKAESMSLLLGEGGDDVCAQLLLCAERLGDMYTVLGDEAYSDAKNPTIGFGNNLASVENQPSVDFGSASSGLFCFDNQVRTLLDEELALLRGRTGESAPVMTLSPFYNRLIWNFTKGVTAGEVAYAVNYNIEGTETTALSETQASILYPQGHGDAYGHYLSALKGWFRLMRNPYFNWVRKQGEMNLADASVNVDYYEEAKFAEAALKVAKTAADVVDLTARKAHDDDGQEMAGYRDEVDDRAFGYGEWANRGAYGALANWAVANSLLPESSSDSDDSDELEGETSYYTDSALMRIDRGTVDELAELCTQAEAIQSAEDRIDAGLNPLGLNENAIPFDITPIGANDGTKTHFEQIRERAGTAVKNARTLLDKAQEYSNRLRMIQEAADDYEDQIEEEELAYNQELIGYYGKPYSDDVGPGATYEQDYDGPDLIHYMWMDISKYGLEDVEDSATVNVYYFDDVIEWSAMYALTSLGGQMTSDYNALKSNHTMIYQQSASGLIVKPDTITGSRPMQGSIQDKYGEFLAAYAHYKLCLNEYQIAAKNFEYEANRTQTSSIIAASVAVLKEVIQGVLIGLDTAKRAKQKALNSIEYVNSIMETADETVVGSFSQVTGAGMTVVTDPSSFVKKATSLAKTSSNSKYAAEKMLLQNKIVGGAVGAFFSHVSAMVEAGNDYYKRVQELLDTLVERADAVNTKYMALSDAQSAMVNAIEAYNSEVAKGEMVLEKREAARKRQVNKIAQWRYNDMFFRQLRNQALSRYSASFDLAQKYVWEAAKAYDYETGLLKADEASGQAFLNRIVTSRALGSFGSDGEPIVGDVGDTGLAGVLAEMDANWLVLKPRLGINNPQPYATWFSLRGELFRILEGEDGDAAWSKELAKYWTDDIQSDANFKRYCQPFQSKFGLQDQEPGLVIPFETTIDFAKNFFGNDLAGGDNAYDSTWYATRIYAAGVWFDGYNAKADGTTAKVVLANTPVVYLVPMGEDCMRVPGLDDGTILTWNVVDQVIAAPYSIGSTYLNDLSWYPTASDGDLGGADETTKIRKHPSFRAYFDAAGGSPTDAQLDCTRLVGRSVWNTKWMLVIPAGSMNADRDKALSVFINGSDTNRDGKLDLKPVSDIKIGFKTYSNSGN